MHVLHSLAVAPLLGLWPSASARCAPFTGIQRDTLTPPQTTVVPDTLPARDTITARDTTSPRDTTTRAARRRVRDSVATLGAVRVTARRAEQPRVPALQAITLPATAGITAQRAAETVNVVDPEDLAKYLPSVFVRKRNYGDTQATLQTRVWGVSSSARTLVFADGVPLTALVANNNTIGGPRWGLVAPIEISRVDLMFGPFSAAYAGNSLGAVMEITTRLPDHFEGTINQTGALQGFDLYGTRSTYGTSETQGAVGDRVRPLRVLAQRRLSGQSQPATHVRHQRERAGRNDGSVRGREQARRTGERARRDGGCCTRT